MKITQVTLWEKEKEQIVSMEGNSGENKEKGKDEGGDRKCGDVLTTNMQEQERERNWSWLDNNRDWNWWGLDLGLYVN